MIFTRFVPLLYIVKLLYTAIIHSNNNRFFVISMILYFVLIFWSSQLYENCLCAAEQNVICRSFSTTTILAKW